MNLIEKLGGYEKAKNIRLGNEEDWMFYSIKKDWYSDIKHDESFIFIDDLKYQLLQYRRQHGIYEIGDSVVSRCADKETRIFKYEKEVGKNIIVKCKKGLCYCYPKKWFSHATPEEIAAVHRIESSNEQEISDCCSSNLDKNESQSVLSIKQGEQP